MGGLFLVGAGCWAVIDPRRPVFAAHPETLDSEVRLRTAEPVHPGR
jgi:hypothetical protein